MIFRKNVFVNCPFDAEYLPLLRPILFTIVDAGLTPRIALETLDSGSPRIAKISKLIRQSKYAIHDLSRIKSSAPDELSRFNMPFELGVDVGCRLFGKASQRGKKCLILEAEKYRYQAALSDLSNSDIEVHGNEPQKALTAVRNWLSGEAKLKIDGPAKIWNRFNDFMADNYVYLKGRGYSDDDISNLPVKELIDCIRTWKRTH